MMSGRKTKNGWIVAVFDVSNSIQGDDMTISIHHPQ